MSQLIPLERIQNKVFLLRGKKVLLDEDLAKLYGVKTKRLNEQIRRNRKRFPSDFMFQLSAKEAESLRSQFATSNTARGGRRYRPFAFTEQGVAMLSSVLNSERAIQVNIAIMRAFVRLREMVSTHRRLARKLKELEEKFADTDGKVQVLFEAIRELMDPSHALQKKMGFHVRE